MYVCKCNVLCIGGGGVMIVHDCWSMTDDLQWFLKANFVEWFVESDWVLAMYCFVMLMANWLLSLAIQTEAMESSILPEKVAHVAKVMLICSAQAYWGFEGKNVYDRQKIRVKSRWDSWKNVAKGAGVHQYGLG